MIINIAFFDNPAFRQTVLSLCISMSFFCIGLVRGYSAPAVPSILDNDPDLLPTKTIASWASSIPPCGAVFGSLLAGSLLHYIGRKNTIIVSSPLATLGWGLIASAGNHQAIIIGRFITGFCVGLCLPSAQVYIGESCDPHIRGVLGSLPTILMSLGIVVAYVIGSVANWDYLAWYCCFMTFLLSLLMSFLPESPVWLRSKNRLKDADKATAWLKLQLTTVPMPITAHEKSIAAIQSEKMADTAIDTKSKSKYFVRPVLMPLMIGLTLLVIQQVSGIDAIIFFTVEIFRASGSSINEHLATIIVGVVQLLSNIASLFVVDKAGRKPLLIISGIIMWLSMTSMGTAFYLKQHDIESFGLLPLISLIIFMIGFSVGFGCIPFLLLGELFPAQQRSMLSAIAGSFNLGVMFIVIKTYHYLEELITTAGTFWMYAGMSLCGVIFVIGVVPETKGRDLDSIAKLFVKNRRQSMTSTIGVAAAETATSITHKLSNNDQSQVVLLNETTVDKNRSKATTVKGGSDSEVTKL